MGGTGNLVKALSKLMVELNIKITLNTTINKFILKNKKISSIIDHKGKERKADIYISNLDPLYLYKNLINKNENFILKYKKNLPDIQWDYLYYFLVQKRNLIK